MGDSEQPTARLHATGAPRLRLAQRYVLDLKARRMDDRGEARKLGARAFDLLSCLARHAGSVVPKEVLLDAVWPRQIVTENNLNAQVSALRKLLGPKAIVTIAGVGYQLGLPVEALSADAQTTPPRRGAHAGKVAVLRFASVPDTAERRDFTDGLATELIESLSRFRELVVLARGSSFAMPIDTAAEEIGTKLGVRWIVTGTARKWRSQLRINVQLADAGDGRVLWSARFDEHSGNPFALQEEIAARIASAVEPTIRKERIEDAVRAPTMSLVAYDLYLRALPRVYAMHPSDNDRALGLLLEAIEQDPTFTTAKAHAAWCYEQRVSRGWPNSQPTDRARAVSLAREVLHATQEDARDLALAGFVLLTVGRDPVGLAVLERAAHLNPSAALIASLAGTGQLFAGDLQRAEEHLRRARRLSPGDPSAYMLLSALACVRLLAGDATEAVALATESLAIHPDWDFTLWVLASAAGVAAEHAIAQRALARLEERSFDPAAPKSRTRLAMPTFRIFTDSARRSRFLEGLRRAGLGAAKRTGRRR